MLQAWPCFAQVNLNKADSAAIRTSGSLSELVIADGWTRGTAQLDERCDRAIFFNTLQFIFKKLCDHEDFFFCSCVLLLFPFFFGQAGQVHRPTHLLGIGAAVST